MADHAATTLALAGATGLMVAVMPKLTDVRRADANGDVAADVRTGLFVGGGLLLAFAAVASYMARDGKPLVAALVAVAAMTAGYEFALRTDGIIL